MNFELEKLVRSNIRNLTPYSSARSEFSGAANIFLDANENAFGSPAGDGFNRYPDPLQTELKKRVSELKGVASDRIFIGNGSDEAIDLLFRIFCEPGRDACIICPPTYGMYGVSAAINDIEVVKVLLDQNFQLDVEQISEAVAPQTKLLFICSPNNPTGNLMQRESVLEIANSFAGLVVVDEAYIDFASSASFIWELDNQKNLVVLQTFSKAWGMAGLRIGMAFAQPEIIDLMNKVKPPYNVSGIAQKAILAALDKKDDVDAWLSSVLKERARLADGLAKISAVQKVYASDANFLLTKTVDAESIYRFLIGEKIVVRSRNNVELCEGCLRITVGTVEENNRLLKPLENFGRR